MCMSDHSPPPPLTFAAMDWLTQWECVGAGSDVPASACAAGGRGAAASAGNACTAAGGRCEMLRDGFYLLSGERCVVHNSVSLTRLKWAGWVAFPVLQPVREAVWLLAVGAVVAECKFLCPPSRHKRRPGPAHPADAAEGAATAGGVAAQRLARRAHAQQGAPGVRPHQCCTGMCVHPTGIPK